MTETRVELPASVGSSERLRLFVGFPVPAAAGDLAAWAASLDAPDARRVGADGLHFTIAFLGHRPRADADRVAAVLDECAPRAVVPEFFARRYRETARVGMLVCEERSRVAHGREHAVDVQRRLHEEGLYVPERRPWLPHVTVLRFRKPPGLRPSRLPADPITPSETAAYLSLLGSAGAHYEIIHRVQLGR